MRWNPYAIVPGQPLSALEEETMQRLANGETFKEIEAERELSKNATNNRVRRVREKLGAQTTLQAMAIWATGRGRA